jgi:hypothetical protein
MARPPPEPVQVVKQRRDAALKALVDGVPYIRFSASSSTAAGTS